ASLRVQQRKKPSGRSSGGGVSSSVCSLGEKNWFSIPSKATSGLIFSTSIPTSCSKQKANRANPCECERLNRKEGILEVAVSVGFPWAGVSRSTSCGGSPR